VAKHAKDAGVPNRLLVYARNRYRVRAPAIKAKKNTAYHANPKKFQRAARRSRKKNLESVKASQAKYRDKRRSLITLGKRAEAGELLAPLIQSPPPKPSKAAGRKTTKEKIALVARLELKGRTPYQITDLVYPHGLTHLKTKKLLTKHDRFHRLEAFIKYHRERIDLAKQQAHLVTPA
jgi:hypothetical protein